MASQVTHYPRLARLALPITRLELPGCGKVFNLCKIGGTHDDLWKNAPIKIIRGKLHGYLMDLDLRNWSERASYFLGRFYDFSTQAMISQLLRPGERMVDIGANIGMITLHAAALVGPDGQVDAFEPNPVCQARIKAHLERNRISQVKIHGVALSDRPGSLILHVPPTHTGMGTLASLSTEEREHFSVQVPVAVEVGDEVIGRDAKPVDLVKIDVEGFECHVIRGLEQSLARWKPPILTEVIGEHLVRAGSSVAELFDLMAGLGYSGLRLVETRRGLKPSVAVVPIAASNPAEVADVLWVHPQGRHRERLGSRTS